MPRPVDKEKNDFVAATAKKLGKQESTIRQYMSYHAAWRLYEHACHISYPISPEIYCDFVTFLVEELEYCSDSAKNCLGEVKRQHIKIAGAFTYKNPGLASEELSIAVREALAIARLNDEEVSKARPLTIDQFEALPQYMKKFVATWCQTGARTMTASRWRPENCGFIDSESLLI